MSDDDRDIDIESDDDEDGLNEPMQFGSQAEKRAHHNALERKRRDHIKDSFSSLRDSVPALSGEKSSRAQILKKAADYIEYMRRKNTAHQQDIDDLKKQNNVLETQIRSLEKAKYTGNFAAMTSKMPMKPVTPSKISPMSASSPATESSESSDMEAPRVLAGRKKLKT